MRKPLLLWALTLCSLLCLPVRSVAHGQAMDMPSLGQQAGMLNRPEFHVWARPSPVFDYRRTGRLARDGRIAAPGCDAFLLEPDEGTDVEELIAEAMRQRNARILWPEHMTQADLEAFCRSVPSLEALWFRVAPHVRSVGGVGSLSSLREVRMPRCVNGRQLSAFLKNTPAVKELRFGCYATIALSEDVLRSIKEAGVEYLECPPSTTDAQVARLVADMPNLRGISVAYCPNIQDPSVSGALRSLEWVELSTVSGLKVIESFVDEREHSPLRGLRAGTLFLDDLAPFSRLESLESLVIENFDRRLVIEPLGALENLRHLELGARGDSANVEFFSGLGKLKQLRTMRFQDVRGEPLDVDGLQSLEAATLGLDLEGFLRSGSAEVPSVKRLDLVGHVGRFDARWLRRLPSLVALDLEAIDGVPGSALLDLGKLKSLRRLRVWMSFEDSSLEFLKDSASLRELDLCIPEAADVKPVGRLAGLEYLGLMMAGRPAESLDALSELENLVGLSLASIGGMRSVDFIADLPKLRRVELRHCQALRNIEAIGKLKGLRVLKIERCGALESIGPIAGAQDLRVLRIEECEVRGLEALSRLSRLRVLEIVGCRGVEETVVEELKTSLRRCRIEIRD